MTVPLLNGLTLSPLGATGAPAAGAWEKGAIICDSAGVLWVCGTAGTPGTWSAVGSGAAGVLWGKITNATAIALTAAASATLNRLHAVSGSSYTITISGLTPSVGDVVGFYVKDIGAATGQFTLDAGGTVKIAGRTRFLVILHTNVVLLMWDGTDWQPLVLCLDTPWVNDGANVITGITTNPTPGTTSPNTRWWRRRAGMAEVEFKYSQTVAGAAGSGGYLWQLPFGLVADTTFHDVDTTTATVDLSAKAHVGNGAGGFGSGSAVTGHVDATLYDTTHVRFVCSQSFSTYGFQASAFFAFSNAALNLRVRCTIAIANW